MSFGSSVTCFDVCRWSGAWKSTTLTGGYSCLLIEQRGFIFLANETFRAVVSIQKFDYLLLDPKLTLK